MDACSRMALWQWCVMGSLEVTISHHQDVLHLEEGQYWRTLADWSVEAPKKVSPPLRMRMLSENA